MSENTKIKRIPKSLRPQPEVNDDLKRLVNSMRVVLRRAYPNRTDRQTVAREIMGRIQETTMA